MRYRVNLRHGSWASFDETDAERAKALYVSEGLELRLTADLRDDVGELIAQREPGGAS